MAADVAKWETLLGYISVVGFISMESVVVKLKLSLFNFLYWSTIHEVGPFCQLWPLLPQILWDHAEILTSSGLQIIQTQYLKNPSKVWNLNQMERTQILQFWSILKPNILLEIQKYCLYQNFWKNYTLEKYRNNIEKYYYSCKIRQKQTFFGTKLGIINPGAASKCYKKFLHSL